MEPLIQALDDENKHVRKFAAEALGKIGDARTVQPLEEFLNDLLRGHDPYDFLDDVQGRVLREKKIRGVVKKALGEIKKQ